MPHGHGGGTQPSTQLSPPASRLASSSAVKRQKWKTSPTQPGVTVPSSELWVQRLQNASRNRLFPLLLPWRRSLHPQHKSQLQEAASNVQVTASPLKFHPITHNAVTGFREGRIDPPISPDLSPFSSEPIERKLQPLPFPPRCSVPSICR